MYGVQIKSLILMIFRQIRVFAWTLNSQRRGVVSVVHLCCACVAILNRLKNPQFHAEIIIFTLKRCSHSHGLHGKLKCDTRLMLQMTTSTNNTASTTNLSATTNLRSRQLTVGGIAATIAAVIAICIILIISNRYQIFVDHRSETGEHFIRSAMWKCLHYCVKHCSIVAVA